MFQAKLFPLSLPFNLSTLLFLCVTSSAIVRPREIRFPEKHLRDYKQLLLQRTQVRCMQNCNITLNVLCDHTNLLKVTGP
jgi:hypothetical protein